MTKIQPNAAIAPSSAAEQMIVCNSNGNHAIGPNMFGAGPESAGPKRVQIRFRVAYMTKWGQHLVLCGAGALLGNWNPKRGHLLRCQHEKDELVWEGVVSLPWQQSYTYKYAVVTMNGDSWKVENWESAEHTLALHEDLQHAIVVEAQDQWQDRSYPGSILRTDAYTKVLKRNKKHVTGGQPQRMLPGLAEAVVRFHISDWMLEDGETVYVTGSLRQLGNWQPEQMVPLTELNTPTWEGEVIVPYHAFQFTYKYAIRTRDGIVVEVGEPRVGTLSMSGHSELSAPGLVVMHDGFFRRDKLVRGAGVSVPVFSLNSRESVGAGEFLDLCRLVDFSVRCGLHMIQILPVNDTSVYNMWWDSYPYSIMSAFALHPLYLRLQALHPSLPPDILREIDAIRQELDLPEGKPQVDYEGTVDAKLRIAREVFDLVGDETLSSAGFKEWFNANVEWLVPYAVFCFLRDLFGTAQHWLWGTLSVATQEVVERLADPRQEHHTKIQFTYYLQYHLHLQLLQASRYAMSKGVVLKGDLPIGVDKRSVDTWLQPRIFRMDMSTGSPPDVFSPTGQNWGFPTYNWEEMEKEGYSWWLARLKHMSQYFQAYRIDHILGFFRIWEIPADCVTGLLGHFRPSIPITRSQLQARGIWDLDRLTEPYVRWHLLEDLFGDLAAEVSAKYFTEYKPGWFRLRPQYATEQQIDSISVRHDSPQWLLDEVTRVKKGLLALRQNVLLLQDADDPDKFHPRFGLANTSSFHELDHSLKEALRWLHDDYIYHRHEDVWRAHALKTLPVLMDASNMLVCGEDLGFVPGCVPSVMAELGLVGLRIQRMPTGEGAGEFNNTATYPYLTVASPSCHDVPTIRAWYEEDPDRRERFFYFALCVTGSPPERCTPEIVRRVVEQHMMCPSVWSVFPIQDLLAMVHKYHTRPAQDEIINDPTVPKHYWRFRLHIKLEDLVQDRGLVQLLQDLVLESERASPKDFAELGSASAQMSTPVLHALPMPTMNHHPHPSTMDGVSSRPQSR